MHPYAGMGAPGLATAGPRRHDGVMDSPAPVHATPAFATMDEFDRIEVRVGTIVDAQPYPEARKPAIKLWIDFGPELGIKQSSAQLTVHYVPATLIGRQVCAVVNFAPRQIGKFRSEVLTLGMPDADGAVVLLRPDHAVPPGGRLF